MVAGRHFLARRGPRSHGGEIGDGIQKARMRHAERQIAEPSTGLPIDLFRKESEIIGMGQARFDVAACKSCVAARCPILGDPEGPRKERALERALRRLVLSLEKPAPLIVAMATTTSRGGRDACSRASAMKLRNASPSAPAEAVFKRARTTMPVSRSQEYR